MAALATLHAEATDGSGVAQAIRLVTHDPSLLSALADEDGQGVPLQQVLAVSVHLEDEPAGDPVPPVAGRYALSGEGIRFTPHFPFEAGVRYRARFDPRSLGVPEWQAALTLDFTPEAVRSGVPAEVEGIFPSADELPENLLRFYVRFSQPMRRGFADAEVSLLGPDDQPVSDALYRAPVELWDKNMRCLTVLLDPGRLKRGVGPNRVLGPPLRAGQGYTLVVGVGMTAASGQRLSGAVRKRFGVMKAIRERISTDGWSVQPPAAGCREPFRLRFCRPLDWALMRPALVVTAEDGTPVSGRMETSALETELVFTPATSWSRRAYDALVTKELEDICGNDLAGPFDRPFRNSTMDAEVVSPLIFPFYPR